MATHPKLVNKQFNSPINLYSKQNVQEVLDRETQILANGAVGIDFRNNPTIDKPGNLKNSAVLRMLEEEESRQRNGFGPGAKRVAWPPPNETGFDGQQAENEHSPKGAPLQYSTTAQSPSSQNNNHQQYPTAQIQTKPQLRPLDVTQRDPSPLTTSNQSPKGWAPVHSPTSTHFQAAHQPVTQQTYLGAQYQPTRQNQYQTPPANQQYQSNFAQQQASPAQQYQTPPANQQYQPNFAQKQYQTPPANQQYQPNFAQQQASPAQQYQTPPANQQYQPNFTQQQYQTPPATQQYQPNFAQQYQAPPSPAVGTQQYQQNLTQQQSRPVSAQQQQETTYQVSQQYQSNSVPQQQSQQRSQSSQQYQQSSSSSSSYQVSSSTQYRSNVSQQAPAQQVSQQQVSSSSAQVTLQSRPPVQPPPSTITLRPQPPISQAPPPLITSQPATATLRVKVSERNLRGDLKWPPEDVKIRMFEEAQNTDTHDSFLSLEGGKHLRGDLKWPPENVKRRFAEEDRLRAELELGPACRPTKPNKDYTEFFDSHRLNSMYPGYKIPPGTQFYRPV